MKLTNNSFVQFHNDHGKKNWEPQYECFISYPCYNDVCTCIYFYSLSLHDLLSPVNSWQQGVLAIRRIFSLVDMITNTKFSNCPNVLKIGVVQQ